VLSGALRSRNFRLLLACDVVSLTGSSVALVATPFAVLAVGGSAGDVGYVTTAMLVPVVVFLLLGGVIADRLPRYRVMVAGNVVQAAAQAASAAVVLSGHGVVWQLLVLAIVRGAGFGFYFPAEAGLLPLTVTSEDRTQANAIDRVGRNGAQIAGTALGGVSVAALGPGWGLALDAASFALAALLLAGMRFAVIPLSESAGMVRELREGWREFISRRWLWIIVVQFAFVNAIAVAAIDVIGPLVAKAHYGGARNWGLILAAYSAGSVIGGLAMIRLRPARMLLAATIAVPLAAPMLFALAPPLTVPLVAVAALLAGASLQVFGVNWATTMQQEIPLTALSRVSAYDALGSLALAPVGTAVAGPLAADFGTSPVLAVGGALVVILTAAVLIVPEVRKLRRQTVPASTQEHVLGQQP
jgi:predicted MFS family arabinose efflux permease